jgi:hypothetical protein
MSTTCADVYVIGLMQSLLTKIAKWFADTRNGRVTSSRSVDTSTSSARRNQTERKCARAETSSPQFLQEQALFPHIIVTGYRADGAWWVLNGDSGGDGREYIRRSIVCSIGCAAPLQPHTCRDAAAARSPAAPSPLPGFLPFLAPTLFHIASTRRGIHLQLDRSDRKLALRS